MLDADANAEGQIWIGGDGQIWRVDGGDFTPVPYDDALKFRKMQFDCEGRLWLCTGKGAHCYDGGQFHRITTEDGLPYPNVNGIWQDREGLLWFATWGGGLARYDPHGVQALTMHTTADGLVGGIADLAEDGEVFL